MIRALGKPYPITLGRFATVYSWGFDVFLPRTIFTFVWREGWRAHLSPDGTPDAATRRWILS